MARKAIVMSILILHMALVLASSVGSVTCVDSYGVVKIEANCEQSCVCNDQIEAGISLIGSSDADSNEHDHCGDCTDFFLSTLLLVSNHFSRLRLEAYSSDANMTALARSALGHVSLTLLQLDRWSKPPPHSTHKIALIKTTIVIC